MREAIGIKRLQAPKTQNWVEVPIWLKLMYTINYFEICMPHAESKKKNELDHFCIDCKKSFCSHCVEHELHKSVKIRRYVYCEVIKRQDINKFFDCSGIQAYHTNKSKVLFLKQRSHQQPSQQILKDHNCIVCGRNLQDACCYCSIACKVSYINNQDKIVNTKQEEGLEENVQNEAEDCEDDDLPLPSPLPLPSSGPSPSTSGLSLKRPRQKSRKGVACRAPFF